MTSSKTPPAWSMPFTSSNSSAALSMRCAAASSKTRPVTAGARGIPSTKSGFSCAPRMIGSRSVNKNDSVRPSRQMRHTISVDVAYHCAQHVRDVFHQATPTLGRRLAAHLIERYQRVPSPKSLAWAGPYASGRTPSWPTSTPAEPATAPPKPSTDNIERDRRTTRGYPNPTNYQLRILLITGGLDASTHTQL